MMYRTLWQKIPKSRLGFDSDDRIAKAYVHPNGGTLLLYRPRSRTSEWHDRINIWAVLLNGTLVRRRMVYGRRINAPPIRWANQMIREFEPSTGDQCRTSINNYIAVTPVRFDELPQSLVQPSHENQERPVATIISVRIPLMLPTLPLRKLIRGSSASHVLSRDEYHLFVENWNEWVQSHPNYAEHPHRQFLFAICMETVLQYRFELIHEFERGRFSRLYHASYCRTQIARLKLGATRRQQMYC